MRYFYDNISTFAIAGVVCGLAWIYGGTVPGALTSVIPFLYLLMVEMSLSFPQRQVDETPYQARARVWHAMKRDPLCIVALIFFLLLGLPFLNHGLCPVCDYPAIAAGADPRPIFPVLPFCVNRMQHLTVVCWFVPAISAAIAVRHALLKHGKRLLLEIVVFSGLGLALLGQLQTLTGALGPWWNETLGNNGNNFFSTFGYVNMAGDYFTTLTALAFGLWSWKVASHAAGEGSDSLAQRLLTTKFWRRHFMLVATFALYLSALFTLSRTAILMSSMIIVLLAINYIIVYLAKLSPVKRVKMAALILVVGIGFVLAATAFMPQQVSKETDTLDSIEIFDRISGKGNYHIRVATEVWKDNLFFGCGGWGYKHFAIPMMTDRELKGIQGVGGANVHNDYLQFLAEHGLVGMLMLLSIFIILVHPSISVIRKLIISYRFSPSAPKTAWLLPILAVPVPVQAIALASAATLIHAFGDCPLRSPAILALLLTSLAAADGFLPHLDD